MSNESLSPYEILEKIYSEEGYFHKGAFISMGEGCKIKTFKNEENLFCLKFEDNKPTVRIGKTISLKTTISGIILGENGGTIEIDKFPDIPFYYSWIIKSAHESPDVEDVVGFDKKDFAEIFTKATAQKIINVLIETVVDSVVASTEINPERKPNE